MSHDTAMGLIQHCLDLGLNVTELYVDTVGPAEKYEQKLKGRFPQIALIQVRAKADSLFGIVSAASICAKVTRDRFMDNYKPSEEYAVPCKCSGYPADENTKKWLRDSVHEWKGFTDFTRMSWGTAKKLENEKCVNVKWREDEDEKKKRLKNQTKVNAIKPKPYCRFWRKSGFRQSVASDTIRGMKVASF
eukprot:TRINITY_DN16906_c0_g1_i1.p1 TRINITY_DN16906_c0_g1~~TRINITY_DN16906_c0_g1_i1.p1  ORF type:complete len:199 (-),score=29.51 TRINITY_DN16906_c0_g1_i1:39-608(-)